VLSGELGLLLLVLEDGGVVKELSAELLVVLLLLEG
jgi:hypothetical protein